MADRTRRLRVEIVGDPQRIQRTFDSIDRSAGRMAKGFGRATTLIGAGLAAMAGGVVVGAIKSMVDEAREAEKVGRQTAAVIKATGGAAKVSAKDVDRLSSSLSNKVGVDDEIIATGANMLLTFRNVRNEVGKGNDIFNQASRVALDMTAAMNQGEVSQQGLQRSTIQLGKALSDPIRGITALTRVGVTFTQGQKDQIKALVESGRTMEAQRIILAELKTEFGGAAEAAADPWKRLGVVMGNIKERIGTALLPALSTVASVITDRLIPAAESWWSKHGPAVRDAFGAIGTKIGTMIGKAQEWWETHGPAVRDAFLKAKDEVVKLGRELGDLKKDWDDNKAAVGGLIDTMRPLTDKILPAVTWLTHRLAADEIGGKFGLIAQVGFLSKAFSFAFKRVIEEFRPVVNAILFGNQKMIASAATVAEALHLPMARSLRRAEQRMGEFRRNFNEELDRITDERVNVTARAGITWTAEATKFRLAAGRMAVGGPVRGPGTSTSDSIPAWLSTGEHVWTAREVTAAGGHQAMEAWRRHVRGFAQGGAIDPRLRIEDRIQVGDIDRMVTGVAKSLARGLGEKLTKAMGQVPAKWGSGSWMRAISELRADGVPFNIISTFRRGAITAAGGRTSFHALNRAVDLTGPNMMAIWQALTDTRPTELIFSHAPYYIARGRAKPIEALDNITFMNHLSHVHAAYDRGGWLPPGTSIATNRTGRPERVLGPGEAGVTVNFNGPVYGADARVLAAKVQQLIREDLRRRGMPVTV